MWNKRYYSILFGSLQEKKEKISLVRPFMAVGTIADAGRLVYAADKSIKVCEIKNEML